MSTADLKAQASREIDRLAGELRSISLEIHANPELGYQERLASRFPAGSRRPASRWSGEWPAWRPPSRPR